jgi:hypothetical protein
MTQVPRQGVRVSRQAGLEPGTVEVRLFGSPEDTATVISVLERLATGLPVTTIALDILYRSGGRVNRRDPGERIYMLVRATAAGTGASGSGSTP